MKALTLLVDEAKPAGRSDTLDDVVAAMQETGSGDLPTEPPAAIPVVSSTAHAEPKPEAPADIPASEPLPTEALADIPASEPLPTEARADIPASEPLPTEARADIPASEPLPTEARADIPASEPLPTGAEMECTATNVEAAEPVELEHDLERLMVFEEATAAKQRAEEAESMHAAVNKLVLALLKSKGSLDADRSAQIPAVLGRRDSIDDIESLASELERQAALEAQVVSPDPEASSHRMPPRTAATLNTNEPVKEAPAPTDPKSAVKEEAPSPAPTHPKSAVKEEAQAPAHTSSAKPKETPPSKAEPDEAKEKTPEEILAEFQEKEAKRLAHNSYVRYGRSLRNSIRASKPEPQPRITNQTLRFRIMCASEALNLPRRSLLNLNNFKTLYKP